MMTPKDKKALQEYYDTVKKVVSQQTAADPHEPAAVRTARIERLLGNFTAFCEYYFPQFCKSPFGWFHKAAAKKIIADPNIFAVLEWPRAHSKSVFSDVMMPLYLKAKQDLNGMIVVSNNQQKAIGLLIDIQVQLEGNSRYIADFGEQKSFGDWSEGTFTTQDGVGFWAFGRGQSPRGTRKAEKRPDYIVVDDIDDKEICKNQDRVLEAVNWVREDLFGCFDLIRGRFIIAGNRIHRASILAHLVGDVEEGDIVNPQIYHCKVYALENSKTHGEDQSIDGKPAWKERFTREQLESAWAKIGYISSQREYFHKHIQVGRIFTNEHILWTKPPNLSVYSHIVTYNDPSFKDTKKNDYKAILAIGKLGKFYDVLGMWIRQGTTGQMVKAHYDLAEFLNEMGAGSTIVEHWMEANFIQDLILDDYVTESVTRGYMLPIRGDDRKKSDKFGRIEGMSPLFERSLIRFADYLKATQDFRNFKDQFIGFQPPTTTALMLWKEASIKSINALKSRYPSSLVVNAGQTGDKMFLTKADLDATIYPEIVTMMSRYSEAIINMNLTNADGDLTAYLGNRYDIGAELAKTGSNRNAYLLSLARDLAIYHLYSLQETIPAHRTKRYDQALAMLKLIQDGKSTLPGVNPAPLAEIPAVSGQVAFGGNKRRTSLQNPFNPPINNPIVSSTNGYV